MESTGTTPPPAATSPREQWRAQGYLVLRNVLDASHIARLRTIVEHVYAQWRTRPMTSEPGDYGYEPNAWIILHLNHPGRFREHPEYLRDLLDTIAEPVAIRTLEQILGDDPLFSQAAMFINPPGRTRPGNWHRDCQYQTEGEEAERAAVQDEADPPREVHLNIPLLSTRHTWVVPGSHLRWDTPEERDIRLHHSTTKELPGAVRLELEPGDLAFFHVNSLHRGTYHKDMLRRTLNLTYSRASVVRPASGVEELNRTKGYVSTFQPWCLKPGYLDGVRPETREFFERFIRTYRDSWRPEYLSDALGAGRLAYFRDF